MTTNVVALDRLKSQLLTSGLQEKNFPLYQVINQLIDFLRQSINETQTNIAAITPSTSSVLPLKSIVLGSPNVVDGIDGLDGERGIQGPKGDKGLTGPMGPPGFDGIDIECEVPTPLINLDGIALLNASNRFTKINPIVTNAESWIGPSSTTGIYFKAGFVGIGLIDPTVALDVVGSGQSPLRTTCYGNSGGLTQRRASGTIAIPTAVQINELIAHFSGSGYDGANFSTSVGLIGIYASENFTNAAQGTYIVFGTTPNGTINRVERMRILNSGKIGINTTAPAAQLAINGGLHVGGDSDPGDNNLLIDGTLDAVGASRLRTLGAFVAGDLYVVADANGNLHLSTLGPGA